jgi:PAS domain S-box-containing protein
MVDGEGMTEPRAAEHAGEQAAAALTGTDVLVVGVDAALTVTFAAGGCGAAFPTASALVGRSAREAFASRRAVVTALEEGLRGARGSHTIHAADRAFTVQALPVEGAGSQTRAVAMVVDAGDVERSLRRREAQLHLVFAQMPSAVWVTDRELRLREVTGTLLALMRREARELVGRTVPEIFGPNDPAHVAVGHHLSALGGQVEAFEIDREGGHFDVRVEPLRDDDGAIIGTIGAAFDVTTRVRSERRLKKTVSLLRATLDSTADGILVVDRDGRVTAMNQRFAEMWHLSEGARASRDDATLLARVLDQLDDPNAFMLRVQELYAHPEEQSYDVLQFRDGRVFERYSRPQRLDDQIVGRVWSYRDVTDRERLLKQALFLADASRLLASLEVESAAEAVARLAVPLIGETCALDLFADHVGPRRLFAVSAGGARQPVGEVPRGALAGHSLIYVTGGRSAMAVPMTARDTLLGVISFIAPEGRRYSEADLQLADALARRVALALDNARLYRGAKEALRARDEFLSVAAHELRGPATALRLAVQTLRAGEVPPELVPRTLEVCDRQVKRVARFIDELLDVSRVRAGTLQLELEDVDLAEVVREVAARAGSELVRSGSALSITAEGRVEGTWDRSRLEQLVGNLLSNAIKYGLGRPIEIIVRGGPSTATLAVRDHGIGIAKDKQRAIFDPFERAVSARHYGGLGLGLYICRSIVNALGGTISIESEPDRGSTFTVELPRAMEAPHAGAAHEERAP